MRRRRAFRPRISLGALAVDPVVEMQDTPTDRRIHLFHGGERTRASYQLEPRVVTFCVVTTDGQPPLP